MATKTIQTPLSYDACRICDLEIGDVLRESSSHVEWTVFELDVDGFRCVTADRYYRDRHWKSFPGKSKQLVYLIKNARK